MNILAKESCLSDCKITEFILIQRTLSSGNNQKGPDIFMSDPHQNLFRYSILSSVIPIATFGVQSLHPLPDCCMESIILHFVSHLVKIADVQNFRDNHEHTYSLHHNRVSS